MLETNIRVWVLFGGGWDVKTFFNLSSISLLVPQWLFQLPTAFVLVAAHTSTEKCEGCNAQVAALLFF